MPSRRKLIALSAGEIAAFLARQRTIIAVGNGAGGYPHAAPLWFHRTADGCIHCTTFAKSQKVLNWRRDPRATLVAESGQTYETLKAVMIYARCEVVCDPQAVVDTLLAIHAKGRDDRCGESPASLRESTRRTAAKRVVLRFVPERYVSWDHAKLGGGY